MNIDDYRYILTIAEEGSITKASKKLYVTQPALSQRVKWIRDMYGIDIFTFDTDGAHLTRDAQCFVKYAQQILNCEENLKQELTDLHDLQDGVLRLGISQLANSYLFQNIVSVFHKKHPSVQLSFTENNSPNLEAALLANKIDIGIFHPLSTPSSKLCYEIIFNDRLILVPRAESPLFQSAYQKDGEPVNVISPNALADEPLALPEVDTRVFEVLSTICQSANVIPHGCYWSKNYAALYCLSTMGVASAIMLESYLSDAQRREVYFYLDTEEVDSIPTAIFWNKDRYLSKIAQEFLRTADQVLKTELS